MKSYGKILLGTYLSLYIIATKLHVLENTIIKLDIFDIAIAGW